MEVTVSRVGDAVLSVKGLRSSLDNIPVMAENLGLLKPGVIAVHWPNIYMAQTKHKWIVGTTEARHMITM